MKIRGLLLKDIFELWAQCRVQLVLTGVYLLLPLFASVGMMLLAMMPIYALGYDERCRCSACCFISYSGKTSSH